MNSLIIFLPAIDPGFDANGQMITDGRGTILLILVAINILLNLPIDPISSFGMYRIAKRRNLPCPWLAWIPLINLWTLGSIADQHTFFKQKKRGVLRWFMLVHMAVSALICIALWTDGAVSAFFTADTGAAVPFLFLLGLAGTGAVFVALARLYASCLPRQSPIFTMLSILFSIPTPFFMLKCCDKDYLMY